MSYASPYQCCRSLSYSPDGSALAAGLNNGAVKFYDGESLEELCAMRDRKQWIQVLKYSPDGDTLAVGSHDNFIDIYDTSSGDYSSPPPRTAVCSGHQSFITHIDWSVDAQNLRSNCGAYELLFWEAGSGAQLPG